MDRSSKVSLQDNPAASRPCPWCAEFIKPEAINCRHCNQNVTVSIIFKSGSTPLTAKELHQATLKLMSFRNGLFAYQQLKQQLITPNATIASGLSYRDAEQLCKMGTNLRLHLSINSTSVVQTSTGSGAINLASELSDNNAEPRGFTIRLAGFPILLILTLLAGVVYLYRASHSKPLFSEQPPTVQSESPLGINQETHSKNDASLSVDRNPVPQQSDKKSNIQESLIRATVTITDGNIVGSGFFIHPQGYFVTNVHVVEKMHDALVFLENGARFSPSMVRFDKGLDIAILKVNSLQPLPYLPIGDATQISRGETVWTVGAPHGLNFTLTKGIVSFVGRNINGIAYLQTDAAINSGNSGGPMIDEQGRIIGINTFIIKDAEGLGFALPVNYLYMSDRGLLQGIVSSESPNSMMRDWLALNPPGSTATAPNNSFSSSSNSNNNEQKLKDLINKSKQLDNDFSSFQNRLVQENNLLTAQKQTLQQKYNNSGNLSITQEAEVGKQLKSTSEKLLHNELSILEHANSYFRDKSSTLKETFDYAGDNQALKSQVQSVLLDLETQMNSNQQKLLSKKQELETLKAQAY